MYESCFIDVSDLRLDSKKNRYFAVGVSAACSDTALRREIKRDGGTATISLLSYVRGRV